MKKRFKHIPLIALSTLMLSLTACAEFDPTAGEGIQFSMEQDSFSGTDRLQSVPDIKNVDESTHLLPEEAARQLLAQNPQVRELLSLLSQADPQTIQRIITNPEIQRMASTITPDRLREALSSQPDSTPTRDNPQDVPLTSADTPPFPDAKPTHDAVGNPLTTEIDTSLLGEDNFLVFSIRHSLIDMVENEPENVTHLLAGQTLEEFLAFVKSASGEDLVTHLETYAEEDPNLGKFVVNPDLPDNWTVTVTDLTDGSTTPKPGSFASEPQAHEVAVTFTRSTDRHMPDMKDFPGISLYLSTEAFNFLQYEVDKLPLNQSGYWNIDMYVAEEITEYFKAISAMTQIEEGNDRFPTRHYFKF